MNAFYRKYQKQCYVAVQRVYCQLYTFNFFCIYRNYIKTEWKTVNERNTVNKKELKQKQKLKQKKKNVVYKIIKKKIHNKQTR